MDWKYILSISPDNLEEEEKEHLYTKIAWFDSDGEQLDYKKYDALFKISQELMKFKSEQVEALLAELDEIAVKQGEEEAKKQESLDDITSIKSKKSQMSFDTNDDLERKYRELKYKLKQQLRVNETQKFDIDKCKESLSILQEENSHLKTELQSVLSQGDDSRSDMSETATDQYKELVQTVQQKNKQISQLLDDIQIIEKENIILQETVSKLKDELIDASNHISTITNDYSVVQAKLDEQLNQSDQLTKQIEAFQSQIQDFVEEKQQRDLQIDEFTIQVDKRVDEWKLVLEEKDKELKKLKSEKAQPSLTPSNSVSSHEDKSYTDVLSKVMEEREDQLTDLRIRLQEATNEMDRSTALIHKITSDKNVCLKRLNETNAINKKLKNQLKSAHDRCQELQENVDYADKIVESKQKQINEILTKLRAEGQIELSEQLQEIEILKSKVMTQDKQITDYVKITNKLQNSIDYIANENSALRNKLGLPDDEEISIAAVLLKQHKRSKSVDKLEKQVAELEEEKINLKSEIQQMNRKISLLSMKLLNCTEKDSNYEDNANLNSGVSLEPNINSENVENKQEYIELLEENEGLRKGLHEILESIQTKNESSHSEIKSKTLEKLLCTLDTRHISGWYHPAMRLQAELHTMQGINKELREQLKNARLEISSKSQINAKDNNLPILEELPPNLSPSAKNIISNLNHHLLNTLNGYHEQSEIASKLEKKLNKYKDSFDVNEKQLKLLYEQYTTKKDMWDEKEAQYKKSIENLDEQVAILDFKLKEFTNLNADEKVNRLAEISEKMVKLNRKCVYLENEESRLSMENKQLKTNLVKAETVTTSKIAKLTNDKKDLASKLYILEQSLDSKVDRQILNTLQSNLDSLTFKYRDCLQNFEILNSNYDKDSDLLNETIKNLEEQKRELHNKLLNASINAHIQESMSVTNELQALSTKLAQSEVHEIEERQRANHMTNLYGLVKEQLQKSEERLQEQDKYNQEIVRNNLLLQENVTKLEDKLINSVDLQLFTDLEHQKIKAERDFQTLQIENDRIRSEIKALKKSTSTETCEHSFENLEVLNLKHQILDLQSNSDEKALIARLSSDVVLARLSETECQKKLQELDNELLEYQSRYDLCKSILEQEKLEKENLRSKYDRKISNLEDIIYFQRQQYLGSIPLILKEVFINRIEEIITDKQNAFKQLQSVQKQAQDYTLLNEELRKKMELVDEIKLAYDQSANETLSQIQSWHQERNTILIKELRYRKELELNNLQLNQIKERLKNQDNIIIQLEEELLRSLCLQNSVVNDGKIKEQNIPAIQPLEDLNQINTKHEEPKLLKQQETQTCTELIAFLSEDKKFAAMVVDLEKRLANSQSDLNEKSNTIEQQKNKITEMEMNISLFRTQIGDKQSQITFYEKHILELQNKLKKTDAESVKLDNSSNVVEQTNFAQEVVVLKESLKQLQEKNVQQDDVILKYQTLIKRDRDEHSLAAARMQHELKRLQDIITMQEKAYKELQETSIQHPGKAAIDQYINQVHALENHTVELHTTVSTLNSQLQASRQEAVRWQSLANERLESMDQLRTNLEDQHKNEILAYKKDSEKWREEIFSLKELISKRRLDFHLSESDDTNKTLKEKDETIRELSASVKRLKTDNKKYVEKAESLVSPKLSELESANDQLIKDCEVLKKKYEQTLNRERQAKEEVRTLKEQILKKPLSARSDRSDKEERLHKKIKMLETEVQDLKDKLERQFVISEAHKITVSEDFEKWKKQKYWQQMAEKLKIKLQEKTEEYDKLNQTCSGYKILIERLEREKHTLENKVKVMRNTGNDIVSKRVEILTFENDRLLVENEELTAKLQTQQRHSGGLGAAMLEEKLQAQEKKIAILELSTKGSGEIRTELERLHTINENLQKLNLRLESENLELKLDLEKYVNDTPHLREQIHHLENYVEVLKSENKEKHVVTESGDSLQRNDKKVCELERTVFVLKRVVEKLQVENKRLHSSGKPCNTQDRIGYEKLRLDYNRLKEQYGEKIQEVARLEDLLRSAKSKITLLEQRELSKEVVSFADELSRVKAELDNKSQLLDKIKILLQRAASKEKSLLEEIATLKRAMSHEILSPDGSSNE